MKSVIGMMLTVMAAAMVASVSASATLMEIIINSHKYLESLGFYKQEEKPESVLGQPQLCTNGKVVIGEETFDCDNIDFVSFLSLKDLEVETLPHPFGFRSADIWGWIGPSGREITIIALDNGVAVVDTSDPLYPCVLAKLPTTRDIDIWADVKVYGNTLYHGKDKRGGDIPGSPTSTVGVEIYSLLPIDQLNCKVPGYNPPYLQPNNVFTEHGRSHNIVVNTESGRMYSVGSEICGEGFVITDVSEDPLNPQFIGCAAEDGYTHDGQCIIYDGPDVEHHGKEICFGFNEETLTIWDLTDATNAIMLSATPYFNQGYTHQGWVNNDLSLILLDDELDELCNSPNPHPYCFEWDNGGGLANYTNTSTDVFDITDLDNPVFKGAYIHKDISIDHNLYVWGTIHRKGWGGSPAMEYYPDPNYAYLNNYLAGVRVLDIHSNNHEDWFEAGFFDISPNLGGLQFAGAWSGYLHPSGVYAVSSIERGLFILKPRMAYTDEFPQAPVVDPTDPPTDGGVETPDIEIILFGIALIMLGVALLLITALCVKVSALSAASTRKEQKATVKELKATNPILEE